MEKINNDAQTMPPNNDDDNNMLIMCSAIRGEVVLGCSNDCIAATSVGEDGNSLTPRENIRDNNEEAEDNKDKKRW